MTKIKVLLMILTLILTTEVFALEKAIINDNRVNVRSSTNLLTSNILYQLNAGDEILIYSCFGDGTYKNGIYNLWYNISREKTEYVNALYVNRFPFENKYIEEYPEGQMEYYQFITDYEMKNGKLYFYGNFYKQEGSPLGLGIWLEANKINWIENKSKNIAIFYNELKIKLHEQFLLIPTSEEFISYGDRVIKTYFIKSDSIEAQIKVGGLVENHFQSLTVKKDNVILPFGVFIGMETKELINIFGIPDRSTNNEMFYRIGYGFIISILFKTNNNRITQIQFNASL